MITPDITAALAHEIKNPAAVAMAHISLAKSLDITDGISLHLNYIGQAITEINELVHEMLFATHGQPPCYHINFYEMLTEMLETYRVTWPGISFSLNAPNILFHGQEQFIRLIFTNLIKNAIECVQPKGYVSLAAEVSDGYLHVVVCNNGRGASKEYGNGLGLGICQALATRLGGSIEIFFDTEGGVVTVCLPV